MVSKRHCEVFFRGTRPFLRDTSSNGTNVGSETVKGGEVELSNGARIALVMPRNRRALFFRDGVAFIYQDVSEELRRACRPPRARCCASLALGRATRPHSNRLPPSLLFLSPPPPAMFVPSTNTESVMNSYVFQKKLGKGAFGTVWLAYARDDAQRALPFAAKVIDKKRFLAKGGGDASNILKEVRALETLRHPNIVSIRDAYDTPRHVVLFLELCVGLPAAAHAPAHTLIPYPNSYSLLSVGGGTLEDVMTKHPRGVGEEEARALFHQLCCSLEYLHARGVVHRDLKPENVMLTKGEEGGSTLKVTDFGLSRVVTAQSLMTTVCGTPLFLAPEVFEAVRTAQGYDARVDMWSAGVMLHVLLFGSVPFRPRAGDPLHEQVMRVLHQGPAVQLPAGNVSAEARDLLARLLCPPGRRLWAKLAMRHPWLNPARGAGAASGAAGHRELARAPTMAAGSGPAPVASSPTSASSSPRRAGRMVRGRALLSVAQEESDEEGSDVPDTSKRRRR